MITTRYSKELKLGTSSARAIAFTAAGMLNHRQTTAGRFSRLWSRSPFSLLAVWAVVCMLATTSVARAQGNLQDSGGLFPNFSLGGFGDQSDQTVDWKASYFIEEGTEQGRLDVHASVASGWYIYSVTQPPGGPMRTKITLDGEVQLAGDFRPSEPPLKSVSSIFEGVTLEEHQGAVVWSAPITIPTGFQDSISVSVNAQICKTDGACVPISETLTATYAGPLPGSASAEQATSGAAMQPLATTEVQPAELGNQVATPETMFRDEDYEVQWSGKLTPAVVQPGGRAMLTLTAKPNAGFHVYQASVGDSESSTNFVIADKAGLRMGMPKADTKTVANEFLPDVFYHKGDVTWTIPIEVPASAALGLHKIKGMIAYQACTDTSCQKPMALAFHTTLQVGPPSSDTPQYAAVMMSAAKRADVLDMAATTKWVDDIESGKASGAQSGGSDSPTAADQSSPIILSGDSQTPARSFPAMLFFAFIGGVILNVMPCVLPVVGLKVMSFVQQAGEDRKRVFLLNLVYSAGILSVFALLTGLAVVFSLSWGQQFTYLPVRLGLTILMFAMALSYLGLWEIPMPGMASGKASQELQKREGYTGAFFKGVFATVLATPCSGPLLGAILGLTIALSAIETTAVIMTVGFGMTLPYLIIGIWPAMVSWLPKPGDWMETLKEFLAFLFLGTVAFFFNQFSDAHKLPVFVTLIGVWFGCWVIGKVPNWADLEKRLAAWGGGVLAATLIGFLAFNYLGPEPPPAAGEKSIAWVDYDEQKLQQLQAEGRTVLVDFTAKWCVNCIVNYNVAINTEATREMIEQLDAVPMLADWTDPNPQIKAKLEELQSRSIPLLAIYPGSRPGQPIVLRDLVSQNDVLQALQQAGPSISDNSAIAKRALVSAEGAASTR